MSDCSSFSLFFLLFFVNKQHISKHIQSDQYLCPLTILMDTIKYMNRQELVREDPDENVRMHRLILTLAI